MSAVALRDWVPPRLYRALGRALGRSLYFDGGFADWPAAAAASKGYDDDAILERVLRATRAVVAGHAAYERDSVLFDRWQPPFAVVASLLRHAMRHGGQLDVVDFGGSLGSTYRQCKPFLPSLKGVQWHIVEQPSFVAAGRREFATPELHFHEHLTGLPPPSAPRLLLASGVLQYLQVPHQAIVDWIAAGADTILIDRTPMWDGATDHSCIQHVPPHIYPATYPCWILSRSRLVDTLGLGWRLICEFDCLDGTYRARSGPAFEFRGHLWQRRC